MKLVLSFDDGSKQDLKIADLLLQYKLPAIFYIPNNSHLTFREIKMLSQAGFEIGGHTVNHPEDMKRLSYEQGVYEVKNNKELLQGIIGKAVNSFAYPGGKFNDQTVDILKACGYLEARRTGWNNVELPADPYRITPSGFIHPDKKKFNGEDWATAAVKNLQKNKGYFHVFGHAEDIERYNMWQQVEDFFKYLQKFSYANLHT